MLVKVLAETPVSQTPKHPISRKQWEKPRMTAAIFKRSPLFYENLSLVIG
jgi:hypothetical protein